MAKRKDKRERNRINIDVDPALKDAIRGLSYELGIPESQIYQLFAAEGVLEAKKEKGSIWNRIHPIKSPKFRNRLDIDDLLDMLRDQK